MFCASWRTESIPQMRLLESRIERRLRERSPVPLLKIKTPSGTGWPDRLALLSAGRVVWIELKRPGAPVRPKQAYIHRELRALGHDVIVAWSAEEALAELAKFLPAG